MDLTILPSEFQALLRYTLQSSIRISAQHAAIPHAGHERAPQKHDKGFGTLFESIQYSRSFIVTYQFVLLGLLLLFTAVHWGRRLAAWRRRRRRYNIEKRSQDDYRLKSEELDIKGIDRLGYGSVGSASSSSSSTLREDVILKQASPTSTPNEQSQLLLKPSSPQKESRRLSPVSLIRSWLVYQPQPIPLVNKTMPSNGTSLAVLLFISLQMFYLFHKVELSISHLFIFADRASLVFVANLPLLYLFAAKNQPIKRLTGYSYESLNIFHRRLGEVMCLLALLHSAGMIEVWYTVLRPTGFTLLQFLLLNIILLGVGAFVVYEAIYFTSLGSFRHRWYELFLGLHVLLQVLGLVLLWFHHSGSRPYVGAALGIFLIDRVAYRMCIKSTTIEQAFLEVMDDKKTVVVRAKIPLVPSQLVNAAFSSDITHGWRPTSHIFLTILSLAPKHLIQAHPFTIASKAHPQTEMPAGNEHGTLELLIRAQNGFSRDLLRLAQMHSSTPIRLDGPYGSLSAVRMLQDSDHAVIVAGGSGVAVAWPLIWAVRDDIPGLDMERSSDPVMFKKRILFIWIVRERSHLSWLGNERFAKMRARGVEVVVPSPTTEEGHPDIPEMINGWISSLSGNEHSGQESKFGIVCSGPDGMNLVVRNTASDLIMRRYNVGVEIEKFGW